MTDRMVQLQKALDQMGNTHSLEDILALIDSGEMQSFAQGDTWAVTQIVDFPRKRILELFLIVGDLKDFRGLYNLILAFAEEQGCALLRGYGRFGWEPYAKANGWANGARIYLKEM
jgi:hypothetical protein